MFKDGTYDRKNRLVNSYILEMLGGKILRAYKVKAPRHLVSEVMVIDLDEPQRGRDLHAEPIAVLPKIQADPVIQKVIDKLQNVPPEPR